MPFGTSAFGFPATVTFPRLGGMLVLTVASALPDKSPAILLDHPDDLAELHVSATVGSSRSVTGINGAHDAIECVSESATASGSRTCSG